MPSAFGVDPLQTALLIEQGHGGHKVLDADHTDDPLAFSDGNQRKAMTGRDASDDGAERVLRTRNLKVAGHNALHISVTIHTQRFHDALAIHDAHQLRAAHDRKILLQGVNTVTQRVQQGIGGREHGEIGEHDLFHAYRVDDRLKQDALILNLRADEDEKSDRGKQRIVQVKADNDGAQCDGLPEHVEGAAGCGLSAGLGIVGAQQSSGIQRIGREQMKSTEECLYPDGAAQQGKRRDAGQYNQRKCGAGAGHGGGQHQRCGEIGDRACERESILHFRRACLLLAFRTGESKHAADGQQKHGAQTQPKPCGHQQPGAFARRHRGEDEQPQRKTGRDGTSERLTVKHADGNEDDKQRVDAKLHTHPPTERQRPSTHALIVAAGTWLRVEMNCLGPGSFMLGIGMRVIGGRFRSRTLLAPNGQKTRPTSDRLRETLMNVLENGAVNRVFQARVLDLYAGTGAVGIEALSRGAATVTFVEQSAAAMATLEANCTRMQTGGEVIRARMPVAAWLQRATGQFSDAARFSLVFLDPPWEEREEYEQTLNLLGGDASVLLASEAWVVAEHRRKAALAARYGMLHRLRVLEQGDAALSFYARIAEDNLDSSR